MVKIIGDKVIYFIAGQVSDRLRTATGLAAGTVLVLVLGVALASCSFATVAPTEDTAVPKSRATSVPVTPSRQPARTDTATPVLPTATPTTIPTQTPRDQAALSPRRAPVGAPRSGLPELRSSWRRLLGRGESGPGFLPTPGSRRVSPPSPV